MDQKSSAKRKMREKFNVDQVISSRNVDPKELSRLLTREFGPRGYEVEVSDRV